MPAKVLMFQGTGSDVGKSTLVTGLCRAALNRGLKVAPFKPQNMSNNAAACPGGGEIGRAQALQARAAGLRPNVHFNPVLLKPQSDMTAQVVVQGEVLNTASAFDYMRTQRGELLKAVLDSYQRLSSEYDLILVEGAGSPAEINLRQHDIANMGFARAVNSPVCLVGDIDRGGVIAAIAGTQQVIDADDAQMICSFIINRFRGDPTLFDDGLKSIEKFTGWPCRGVVPWLPEARRLPQEDAVVLDDALHRSVPGNDDKPILIVIPMLSRIANFDDIDPLRSEPSVEIVFVPPGESLPLQADAVIIPGTKSTTGDLEFLRQQGWDHDIIALARAGAHILGLCGGFQLLGNTIADEHGYEGTATTLPGLALLNVDTQMQKQKSTRELTGRCLRSGHAVTGYEIHIGITDGPDATRPMFRFAEHVDGAISTNDQIAGTYLHGVFSSDEYRHWWLETVRTGFSSTSSYEAQLEQDINDLVTSLETALDVDALLADAN